VTQTADNWSLYPGFPKDIVPPGPSSVPGSPDYGSRVVWTYEGPGDYAEPGIQYVFKLESDLPPGLGSYEIYSAAAYKGYITAPAQVPEPTTMILLGSGLLGLLGLRRKFKK
jgi:hypothetical protein